MESLIVRRAIKSEYGRISIMTEYLEKYLHINIPKPLEKIDFNNFFSIKDISLLIPFVIIVDGTIIGYFLQDFKGAKGSVSISSYFIKKEYRDKGYGRKALILLLDIFRKEKYETVYISSFTHNKRATNLYKSLGFKETITRVYRDVNSKVESKRRYKDPEFVRTLDIVNYTPKYKDVLLSMFRRYAKKHLSLEGEDVHLYDKSDENFITISMDKNYRYFLIKSNETVIGYMCTIISDNCLYIVQKYLDGEYYGRGVGNFSAKWMIEATKGEKCLATFTSYPANHIIERSMYESNGFLPYTSVYRMKL